MPKQERQPRPLTPEEAIQIGVGLAQKEMKKRGGPKPREVVAHPKDALIYYFVKTIGSTAHVMIPAEDSETGVEIKKEFPVDQLFNPNDANEFAKQAYIKSHLRSRLN